MADMTRAPRPKGAEAKVGAPKKRGPAKNSPREENARAFVRALMEDEFTLASKLLKQDGRLLKGRVLWGETPLHYVATESRRKAVRWLLARGANPSARNKFGDPIICSAVGAGDAVVVRTLLRHGADPNAYSLLGRPLHIAARLGDAAPRMIRVLLQHGGRVNASCGSASRETPLHIAAYEGNFPAVKLLLTAGANPRKRALFGQLPVQNISRAATPELMRLLILRGSPIDAKDGEGRTLLHTAVYLMLPHVTEFLLKTGLNPLAADKSGYTPFDEARRGWRNETQPLGKGSPRALVEAERLLDQRSVSSGRPTPSDLRERNRVELEPDLRKVLKLLLEYCQTPLVAYRKKKPAETKRRRPSQRGRAR